MFRRTLIVSAFIFVGIAATQSGCGSPVWTQVEKTVLTDLTNGVALQAIEQAVEALDPAIAGDVAAADAIIQAAITFLQTVGAIPPNAQPAALAMQQQLGEKLAAAKKSGWVLSPEASKLVAEIDAARNGAPLSARSTRVAKLVVRSFR